MKGSVKICAIHNDAIKRPDAIGYILYDKKTEAFCIELDTSLSTSNAPLFFHSFLSKKIYTLDERWSRKWVNQRIVPQERQNLGSILKEANLKEYDPYRLLIWGGGRSSQDDCHVTPLDENYVDFPDWFVRRLGEKIAYQCPLSGGRMFLAFADGMLCIVKMQEASRFWILPFGNGLTSEQGVLLSNQKLRQMGTEFPMQMDDLKTIIADEIVTSQEAQELLGCTRQNLNYYTAKGMLTNILPDTSHRLYWRHEIVGM